MEIKLGKLKLKNPIILASGTFDRNIVKYVNPAKLGGLITKTVTLEPRPGNPLPHIVKTKYGFLNSVGLKNIGIKKYLKEELPFWQKYDTQIIPSITGKKENEFIRLAQIFNQESVDAIEIDISCPNVNRGIVYSQNPKSAKSLIKEIRKSFNKNLIVKLSPNVTSIIDIAAVCLSNGADILSIANTYLALEIDNKKKKAKLYRKIGGYSGPAIKPLILRMVWEVYKKFRCPIIGSGGIESFDDALDYIMCGATAVGIGSINYLNPKISIKIVNQFKKYLAKNKFEKIRGII
jgi:dihydroorotate dehydrogenase (NAD+) catalytic subunit